MQLELKQAIADYISRMDPNGDVVANIYHSGGWAEGRVTYNSDHLRLQPDRMPGPWRDASASGAEELVRAYLLVRLVKELGYPPDQSIALEKPYSIGRSRRPNAWLDVLVGDRRDPEGEKSFMLIECKSPEKYDAERTTALRGQLFNIAPQEQMTNGRDVRYLVYYTVRWEGSAIREDLEIIDFERYQRFEEWDAAGQTPAATSLPADYGIAMSSVYVAKELGDLLAPGEELLDRTKEPVFFHRLRIDLHNKLWGGSTEYNYIFKNLARLLLAKIFDESSMKLEGKPYRFQIFRRYDPATGNTEDETPEQLLVRLDKELIKPSTSLLGYDEAAKQRYGIEEEYVDANKVAYVVAQLQGISVLDNIHARNNDILGDFFEGMISEGYKQDRGTFFTHKNIVYFLLYGLCLDDLVTRLATDAVNPRLPLFCDPACGSGTFLIEAMRFVTDKLPSADRQTLKVKQALSRWSPSDSPYDWAERAMYGIEANADLALSTKVNMVLHRDGNLHIFQGDGLDAFGRYPDTPIERNSPSILREQHCDESAPYPYAVNEKFDVVLSNPPFSVPLDPHTKRRHRGRFLFAGTRNSEVLFIERYYQLLRPGGRLGVVLPESIFDTAENLPIRLFLYRHFEIWGIVSLPSLAFQPYTATKTCLLFGRKKTREEEAAFDDRWRKAASEYGRLRRYELIAWAIDNKKLHDDLLRMCADLDYAYQVTLNLLHPASLPTTMREDLLALAQPQGSDPTAKAQLVAKVDELFRRIDAHFAEAPFPDVRSRSQLWIDNNANMRDRVRDAATRLGVSFDAEAPFSPDTFTPEIQDAFAAAATRADEAAPRKSQRERRLWERLRGTAQAHLDEHVTRDLGNDQVAGDNLRRFLKSLVELNDGGLSAAALVEKYVNDIAAVGVVNDVIGAFPQHNDRAQPFAHVNAWWAYGEVMAQP